MKLTLHNTTKLVELVVDGNRVPARIWEGHTESGIAVHAYITRVAVGKEQNAAQFEAELKECVAPSPEIQEIPLRLIL